jgi:hypothetical protein
MFEQALKSGENLAETSQGLRIGKDLVKATVPFAEVLGTRRDNRDCFRCCLWDEDRQRVVSYREASRLAAA